MHYEKFAGGTVKCIEDEIPFELPDGWSWERLSNIAAFSSGKTPSTSHREFWDGSVLWVTSKDMKSKYITSSLLMLSEKGASQMQLYPSGTILMVTRSGILRHTLPVAILKKDATVNQDIKAICLYDCSLTEWIYSCLKGMEDRLLLRYTKSGTTVENINFDEFKGVLLPIPPVPEMYHIIDRVQGACRAIDVMDEEKTALEDLVVNAKGRILDLAIRGQLVPQNPDDEPASVLLERIRIEKEELIKQGKVKRGKHESIIFRGEDNSYYLKQGDHVEVVDSQFLFDLPDGWSWCLLPNIAHSELGKTLDQAKNTGDLHPYLRSVNIRWDEVDLSNVNQMRFEPEEIERYTITKGDLLICEGGDVGRSAIWISDNDILYQNALHRVRFWGGINPRFFMYYMMFYESKGIIKDICKGVTIKHLTGNVLNSIPFALPPLVEQTAIVTRIDEAFNLLNTTL